MKTNYLDSDGRWKPAIPVPYYYGLFRFLWLRAIGYRDEYGRKAHFIGFGQ